MSHFRFLDLPRELRDVVYELLILPEKQIYSGEDDQDTKAIATGVPISALLQANKQLNTEYSDQLPSSRRLYVLGGHCDYWTDYPDISGSLARSIDECIVYIHIQDFCDNMTEEERIERDISPIQCDAVDFLYNYAEALREFLSQFQNLRSAHLKVGLWGSEDFVDQDELLWTHDNEPPCLSHSEKFPSTLTMLLALPLEIKDLEVVRCVNDQQYERYCHEKDHGLPTYFTWTRRGGWRPGDLVQVVE